MHMKELILLSPSHILTVSLSLFAIFFIPKYIETSSEKAKKILKYSIVFLLLVNQSMDFYREGVLSNRWEEGLPFHLCDFSTIAIILYFITQNRNFFVFAFFFGIAGGGMSILTPDTIYGLSKLLSYEMVKFFRVKYNLKVCSGILFHHESQLREKSFVLRKIIISAKDIYSKKKNRLKVGNIDIVRDWGWAPEYVKLIHKLNNQKKIEDMIVATGNSYKLKNLIKKIFKYYNLNWQNFVYVDKNLVRKNDALIRRADNSKIKKKMNWKPKDDAQKIIIKLIENQFY